MSEFLEIEAEESENEGDGQPARKKQRITENSSSDEEEDDEKLHEELKDFVTYDEVEEPTASDSDKSEDDADDDDMSDDIDFLRDQDIIVKPRTRVRVESSDEEGEVDRTRDIIADELFDEREEGEEANQAAPALNMSLPTEDASDAESDLDNFIVDEQGQSMAERQKKRATHVDSALQEAQETFGVDFDFDEFAKYSDNDEEEQESEYEDEDEEDDEDVTEERKEKRPRKRKSKMHKSIYEIYEPSELERGFLTERDEVIRKADMPERFSLRSTIPTTADAGELEEEADWIYRNAFVSLPISMQRNLDVSEMGTDDGSTNLHKPNPSWIGKIARALDFMRNQMFETPFICNYRKEYVGAEFTPDHLWIVEEWDEKWMQLKSRRHNQKLLFERMQRYQFEKFADATSFPLGERPLAHEDVMRVERAQSLEELRDLYQHFLLYYGSDIPAMKRWERAQKAMEDGADSLEPQIERPPPRIGGYSFLLEHNIAEVAEKFGLSAEKFATNLEQNYQANFVEQHEVGNPEAYAQQFVDRMQHKYSLEGRTYPFESTVDVLHNARRMIAMQFAFEPFVRSHIRGQFFERAKINVRCTRAGFNEIDENHPCYTVRYLRSKPVKDLQDDTFLKLVQAENDKLLTIEFTMDGVEGGQSYQQEILPLYQSDYSSRFAQSWNQQRALTLQKTLTDLLYPQFSKELRTKLIEESERGVIRSCAMKLRGWLRVAPFRGEHQFDEGDFRQHGVKVAAIAYSREYREAAFCVMLDKFGEVVDFLRLTTLNQRRVPDARQDNRRQDFDNLRTFITEKKPDVVAIASESMQALRIADEVKELLTTIEDEVGVVPVEIVDNQPAIVFMHSEIGNTSAEFRRYPLILKQAISVARRLQDPVAELAQLCNANDDVLCLKLHMYQSVVDQSKLLVALLHEFINRVNDVGLDINNCIPHLHLASTLQYVCGLGPRKADAIFKWIKKLPHQILANRLLLHSEGGKSNGFGMTRQIFVNCAAFIKIFEEHSDIDGIDVDRLDGTRVHIEAYEWARKMAIDALEWDDANPNGALEEIVRNPDKLRELDLDAFADELKKQGYGDRHITLYDIRAELNHRFRDLRDAYQSPSPEEKFSMLTGETPETFYIGKMISCRVLGIFRQRPESEQLEQAEPERNEETTFWECPFCQKNDFPQLSEVWSHFDANTCEGRPVGVRCVLENDVRGFIRTNMISDKEVKNPEERVKPGMALHARITRIDIERFRVDLTTKSSDLRDENSKGSWKPAKDLYYDKDSEAVDEDRDKEKKKKQQPVYIKRVIAHPQFHNINYTDAVKLMDTMDIGDVAIRPSSKGPDHLTLTWKVFDKILQHVDVLEKNKTNDFSIGKTLLIGDDEFEDLDEIIARYVQPMAAYVRDVMNYKYFAEADGGNIEMINEHLYEERRKAPSKAPYSVSFSADYPGKFLLSYLPPGKTKPSHEYVTITNEGYRYRSKTHRTLMLLIRWFKEHFNEAVSQKRTDYDTMYGQSAYTPTALATPIGGTPGYNSGAYTPSAFTPLF